MMSLRSLAAAVAVSLAALAGTAEADPVAITSGRAQLPLSGLVIELPAGPSASYKVSGSWSLDDSASSFDMRDIIDEYRADGSLVAGNWVLIGYFTAGGCDAVLSSETLDKSWTTTATLWGESWQVRGGVYTFTTSLGRRPAALLCRSNAAGQSLLLYRYLVDKPETLTQSEIMSDVTKAGVLAAASTSYSTGRVADILPLRRPETRMRGTTPATRTATLKKTGLAITFPDDGYVWLPGESDNSDFLYRMAPSLPDISLEVTTIADMTCESFIAQMTDDRPDFKPRNIPQGWQAGPTLAVDGATELTLCNASGSGIRLVGIFLPEGQSDIGELNPMITAVGNAP